MDSDAHSSFVGLNIGGNKFCTTIDTLTYKEPLSMLAAMFTGRQAVYKDFENGYVFVDRDGMHFRHILNWLRDDAIPLLSDSEYPELLREAEYYQLLGLVDKINEVLNKKKEDEQRDVDFTRSDIIKCRQSGYVNFRGVNLSGLDLSKLDLSNVNLNYACLKKVNFSHAILGTHLECADAENAIFDNATLNGCEFIGANLRGAHMTGANLRLAKLQGADLQCANLESADLTNANLEGANLEGAHLKGAKMNKANLKGANLRCANLQYALLDGANVTGADLTGAIR